MDRQRALRVRSAIRVIIVRLFGRELLAVGREDETDDITGAVDLAAATELAEDDRHRAADVTLSRRQRPKMLVHRAPQRAAFGFHG